MADVRRDRGIEGDGWFWPLDRSADEAVPGRLLATLDDPINLALTKPMLTSGEPWPSREEADRSTPAVLGYVGNTAVTLLNARVTGTSSSSATSLAARERLRATTVVVGAHLPVIGRRDGTASLIADALVVEFELLEEWMGHRGLSITEELREDSPGLITAATVRYEYPETLMADVPGGHIELQGEWTRPRYEEATVGFRTATLLRICSDSPSDVDDLFHQAASIQLLLSLLTSAAPDIRSFRFHHPDRRLPDLNGTPIYDPAALVVPWARRRPGPSSSPLKTPFQSGRLAVLAFDEIGGIDGLAAWVSTAGDLHLILSMLSSAAFVQHLPRENEFLNVCSAAEGLHRHWHPVTFEVEQEAKGARDRIVASLSDPADRALVKGALRYAHEPSLAKRLRALADRVPLTAARLTGDQVRRWSETAAWVRNQLAHPNSQQEVQARRSRGFHPADGLDYLALAHSVYWISTAALLVEIGVSDELLAQRIGDHELDWYNQQVRDVVARWRRDSQSGDSGFRRESAEADE